MSEVHVKTADNTITECEDSCITLLARDPYWLYVYWEFPDSRKSAFIEDFGQEFWDKSIPVLKVANISKCESFFVRINDFSNNWYINVPDPNCSYMVEIGRRVSEHFFISISNSNCIVTPANEISPDTTACFVNYTNMKNSKLARETGKLYDSYDFMQKSAGISGISSPESYGAVQEESFFGQSSGQLYGKG